MPTRADEVMLIPVDADAAVIQPLVSSVQRDILSDAILVLGDEMLHSTERCFFFDGEYKNKICLRFDPGFIERADRGEYCLDVAGIVSNSWGEDFAITNLRFDLQPFLEDGIQMRVKYDGLRSSGALANGDEVTFRVVVDFVQLERL